MFEMSNDYLPRVSLLTKLSLLQWDYMYLTGCLMMRQQQRSGKNNQISHDPNVSSLLLGAILLEDELYHKRKNSEIADDPIFLLSDEIIGMAIAECIGGTYARFEFTRYDQKKPGILSILGPFLDDAIAGLIAGCTSRLYSECV